MIMPSKSQTERRTSRLTPPSACATVMHKTQIWSSSPLTAQPNPNPNPNPPKGVFDTNQPSPRASPECVNEAVAGEPPQPREGWCAPSQPQRTGTLSPSPPAEDLKNRVSGKPQKDRVRELPGWGTGRSHVPGGWGTADPGGQNLLRLGACQTRPLCVFSQLLIVPWKVLCDNLVVHRVCELAFGAPCPTPPAQLR